MKAAGTSVASIVIDLSNAVPSVGSIALALALTGMVQANPLLNGLVAYYDFEGNSLNSSLGTGGSAFNGTLTNGANVTGTPKAGSGALLLDGVNDYMNVATMAGININAPWSVTAWYRSDLAYAGATRGFVFETSGTYSMSFGLREGATADLTAHQAFADNSPSADASQSVQIADTATVQTWHHILLAFTPGTASIAGRIAGYLDGSAEFNLVIPAGDTLGAVTGLRVGTYRSANDRWFKGSIDEVALWNRTLTPMDALELHLRGQSGIGITTPLASQNLAFVGVLSQNPQAGSIQGTGIHPLGSTVAITPVTGTGYTVTSWQGDFADQPASFDHLVLADARSIALFGPDLTDSDNDGLSNYDELVTHSTDPTLPDTDGDEIPDGVEINTTLTHPGQSDAALVEYYRDHLTPEAAGTVAIANPVIERQPATGEIILRLHFEGSPGQTSFSPIPLNDPTFLISPTGGGSFDITLPAPSDSVSSYLLRAPHP